MSRSAIGLNGWLHWLFWRPSLTMKARLAWNSESSGLGLLGAGMRHHAWLHYRFYFLKEGIWLGELWFEMCNFNMALHESFLLITGLMKHRCPLGSEETLLAENAHLCLSEMCRMLHLSRRLILYNLNSIFSSWLHLSKAHKWWYTSPGNWAVWGDCWSLGQHESLLYHSVQSFLPVPWPQRETTDI